jgi:CRISPR-associated protein Csb2
MLAIGIDYLNGWAMAPDVADRAVPEWPPHPDRVFMALAAAHFETDGDADERGVLEWLEALPRDFGQPAVLTSVHQSRTTVTTFVPVNDEKSPIKKGKVLMPAGSLPIGRDRQPRSFPASIPSDSVTYLVWDRVEPTENQRQLLDQLCRKVTSVGHSASLVRMWVADKIPEERTSCGEDSVFLHLVPSAMASHDRLRVFGPGRLADLESRHNRAAVDEFVRLQAAINSAKGRRKQELKAEMDTRFGGEMPPSLRPTPSLWHGYERATAHETEVDLHGSHFSPDLFVLRQIAGRRFGLESTLLLTEALRNCAMKYCPQQPPPEWLSGHRVGSQPSQRERGHVALLPLPHIARRHAEGHLLGLAIAVPRDVPRRELAEMLNPLLFESSEPRCGWPREIRLTLGTLGECVLEVVERDESRRALQAATWTGAGAGATRWGTVTPFAVDRHAKSKDPWEELEFGVAAACERIGLPLPAAVSVTPVSMFVGAPPAREMPRIKRKSGGLIRQVHAVITFAEPIVGPLLIGAGRYRGFGLCRPLRAED